MSSQIALEKGLFDIPENVNEAFYLNGRKCSRCGRYYFPQSEFCTNCPDPVMVDVKMGTKGKLYSYTNCNYPPPGGHFKGIVPYGLGLVVLDENIIIPARLTENDTSKLKVGMDVVLVLETLYQDDEGNDVVFYAYAPKP